MRFVPDAEPLYAYADPKVRRTVSGTSVARTLVALHDVMSSVHDDGIVIGDFNDLNVLVERRDLARLDAAGRLLGNERHRRIHLIDADSYQFAGFACAVFSERFLDPRLCQGELAPAHPYDRDSDWFAFHVIALRTLLLVGPWGGVYRPADPAARCAPAARPLRRISIFEPEVVLPRGALPPAALPDELRAHFAAVFRGERRGPPPRHLLAELRFSRCTSCGQEHARSACPSCISSTAVAAAAALPALVPGGGASGNLRVRAADPRDFLYASALLARPVAALPAGTAGVTRPGQTKAGDVRSPDAWIDEAALWRRAPLGPARVGGVLAGNTWAWLGPQFGCGFYRARSYTAAFVFEREHGVLDDRARLPSLPGAVAAAHAVIAEDQAWMFLTLVHRGRLATAAIVLLRGGQLCACVTDLEAASPDEPTRELTAAWLAGLHGACACGPFLFVPTDDGLVRVEHRGGQLVVTRRYPETASLMCAADRLVFADSGLLVRRRDDAVLLTLE
jgi:hypothetical protein